MNVIRTGIEMALGQRVELDTDMDFINGSFAAKGDTRMAGAGRVVTILDTSENGKRVFVAGDIGETVFGWIDFSILMGFFK